MIEFYRGTDFTGTDLLWLAHLVEHQQVKTGAGGGTRTRTSCYGPRILSPVRLPFRHTGNRLSASSGGKFSKFLHGRKQPIRGLWQRTGNFIAPDCHRRRGGVKSNRWVPLKDPETVAQ